MKNILSRTYLIACLLLVAGVIAAPSAGASSPRSFEAPYESSMDESGSGNCDPPHAWISGIKFYGGDISAKSSIKSESETGSVSWHLESETGPANVGHSTYGCWDQTTFDVGDFKISSPIKERLEIEATFRIDGYSMNHEERVIEGWDDLHGEILGSISAAVPYCGWAADESRAELLDLDGPIPEEGQIVTASLIVEAPSGCALGQGFRGTVDIGVTVAASWEVTSTANGWQRSVVDLSVTLLEVAVTDIS